MTADEELTAQLAEALHAGIPELSLADCTLIAGAALPVVRRYGDQRAAEELDALADQLCGMPWQGIRNRAAALRGEVTT